VTHLAALGDALDWAVIVVRVVLSYHHAQERHTHAYKGACKEAQVSVRELGHVQEDHANHVQAKDSKAKRDVVTSLQDVEGIFELAIAFFEGGKARLGFNEENANGAHD